MIRGRHFQLSLYDSCCDCSQMAADRLSRSVCRILIALPGPCDTVRREDIVNELDDLLAGHGYQVQAFSITDGQTANWNLAGKRLSPGGIISYMGYLRAMTRHLANLDILHLVYYPGTSFVRGILPSVLLAKFFGKKVVLDYRTPVIFSRGAAERFLVERVWRLCDRVLVLSAYQQQLVSSFGGAAEYIRAGVDLEKIAPRVIKNLQPSIVVATDLEKEHNVAGAIRAFKLVKQKYPRTEMTIIGTGSEETALKNMVERDNIYGITFAGAVTGRRRTELLENSELYLNCSSVDYLSVATAEAFACGLPVLTTPLSGGGEVLRSRENIILLPYNDHVGTAERIIELVENPELTEKLSRSSRKTGESYGRGQRIEEWTRLFRCLSRKCD